MNDTDQQLFRPEGYDGEDLVCNLCGAINTDREDNMPSMLGHGTDDSIVCTNCNASQTWNPFTGESYIRKGN